MSEYFRTTLQQNGIYLLPDSCHPCSLLIEKLFFFFYIKLSLNMKGKNGKWMWSEKVRSSRAVLLPWGNVHLSSIVGGWIDASWVSSCWWMPYLSGVVGLKWRLLPFILFSLPHHELNLNFSCHFFNIQRWIYFKRNDVHEVQNFCFGLLNYIKKKLIMKKGLT